MKEFLIECFGNGMADTYLDAILATVKITLVSTLLAYVIGLPLGVILYGTSKDSIFPNKPINAIIGFIVNIIRSIPFIIILVMTQPLAKLVVGTKIGDNTFIFHLVIASAPFVARMIESSLKEVDSGIIE
ncbi:MAG: methionine ABC transporter permease, partial [Clostridia bacterium]|nr:methionine ABC transporter permease [Clostridia bacterium]